MTQRDEQEMRIRIKSTHIADSALMMLVVAGSAVIRRTSFRFVAVARRAIAGDGAIACARRSG